MDALQGKKVLITGSTGFVGSNLMRIALKAGAEVYIITRRTSDKWRIMNKLEDVNEYQLDLLDYGLLESTILDIKPDIIYHTAVYGGSHTQNDLMKIIESNFIGTVNLVNACMNVDYELFVNSGSSSEYGIKASPMKEEDILQPITDYGVSKSAATLYCEAVANREKRNIVTLRLFSPYGSFEGSTRLIPSIILACLRGENPKIASPDSVRDFIFIEDVLDAFIKVITSEGIRGRIFNIGYGEQHSVGEVVDRIINLTGNEVVPQFVCEPRWPNEPHDWQADISNAKRFLYWEPKYELTHGLATSVKWFEKHIELYSS